MDFTWLGQQRGCPDEKLHKYIQMGLLGETSMAAHVYVYAYMYENISGLPWRVI